MTDEGVDPILVMLAIRLPSNPPGWPCTACICPVDTLKLQPDCCCLGVCGSVGDSIVVEEPPIPVIDGFRKDVVGLFAGFGVATGMRAPAREEDADAEEEGGGNGGL